jgi:4-amino-4-deoxy-L-arabinose transferase-like glycosyltransferase
MLHDNKNQLLKHEDSSNPLSVGGRERVLNRASRSEFSGYAELGSVACPPVLCQSALVMWICLLLACIGTSWFAVQIILIPQSRGFVPDWRSARWVQASDSTSPVAYFRYEARFEVMPDSAFVTVTANQVFRLYVNGVYVGTNRTDFVGGGAPETYMFDVSSALHGKVNVVGLRVVNVDRGMPQARATLAAMWGNQMRYYGTDKGWQATGLSTLVYPRLEKTVKQSAYDWSKPHFDASQWPLAQLIEPPPSSPLLVVNPLVYERPLPTHWLSAGPGLESYFVRQFTVAGGFDDVLLRIVATGEADIFINDHLYMKWNGQVDASQENVVDYLDIKPNNGQSAPYRNGLLLGVYDISPYLHAGTNTIAVHVLAPGTATAKVGLDTLKSAMSMDMLLENAGSYSNPLASDADWHASSHAVAGWMLANNAALNWPAPSSVGRPGASHAYYLPDSDTPRNVQVIPPLLLLRIIAYGSAAVLALWLLLAQVLRRYYPSLQDARRAASLVFLPALACEAALMVLAREPQISQPFPYTWQWSLVPIAIVGLSGLLLWRHAKQQAYNQDQGWYLDRQGQQNHQSQRQWYLAVKAWLQDNWGLIAIMVLAALMVCYGLGYEPYWQDELVSYYAARNIMMHGYPALPSGFVYPKGELYSYMLALVMSMLGTTSTVVPRIISVLWYLLSLPLFYLVANKLFNRRVGWLATAMLAFSPYAMIWACQTRMYEQAQLMVIVVLYLVFKALQYPDRERPVYLAAFCSVIAYFSHEEVFIILLAIVVCVLVGSAKGLHGIPAVLRKKHWWIAGMVAAMVIGIQLSLVYLTHPPVIGSDQSRRPQIQLTTDNLPYYFSLLLVPKPIKDSPVPWVRTEPLLLVNSLLALLGCILAFCRKDQRVRYCALFLLISSCTLIFLFTMQADRYYYPLLPIYYLMGAYAFWKVLDAVWRFARPLLMLPPRGYKACEPQQKSLPMEIAVKGTAGLLCAIVLLVPILPVSNYNLLASRIISAPYHRHYPDYDNAATYINRHMQPGDVVITVAPAVTILYYVGHVDDFFSIDRALFLIERNGQMIETATGAHPLLNQADFETVLAMHSRIWLVTDNGGYQGGVTRNGRFIFPPPDFRLVYEGYGSGVYFRSGDG